MEVKLFKRTFPFICNDCGEFAHTAHEFCGKCGAEGLRKATKADYKNHKLLGRKIGDISKNRYFLLHPKIIFTFFHIPSILL